MLLTALNALSWALLTAGGVFVLIGGLGAMRMPDLFTRIHAASLTDSLGPLLILGGLILQAGPSLEALKLFAILLFLVITGPTAAYALGNAALLSSVARIADEYEAD
jgi:multicomponent Na+:H+ antiporter subunit G